MQTSAEIIQAALKEGRTALLEHEAKELARSAGISVPQGLFADPADLSAIVNAGNTLGFPVALKVVSPGILHKTEAGGVQLNISTSAELVSSVSAMKDTLSSRAPGAELRYFLLEKMMPPGLELLIGGLRDAQFGPSVAFGLGGVWVETLKDAVFGVLPMNRKELLRMITETRAGLFLKGFRNSPPLDQEAALSILASIEKLLNEHREIKEIDLNPVRIYDRGAVALDVRVVLSERRAISSGNPD